MYLVGRVSPSAAGVRSGINPVKRGGGCVNSASYPSGGSTKPVSGSSSVSMQYSQY